MSEKQRDLAAFLCDMVIYVPASADDRSYLLLIANELILATAPPVKI